MASTLSLFIAVPPAFAQHAAKAIEDAARAAGILEDGTADRDAKMKTLVMAFDPASPLDVLQKIASLATSAPLLANGRGDISVQQVCKFYEGLKANPVYANNPSWKGTSAFLEYMLYDKTSDCGAGPLQSLVVQSAPDGRYVWLNLDRPVEYNVPQGTFYTKSKRLCYRVSDNPDHAAQLMSDYATRGTNFNALFKNINTNRVLQNQDAQEVATAMTHVREGALDHDRAKVVRTLSAYDVVSISPINSADHVYYHAAGKPLQEVDIGAVALITPHAMAQKGAEPNGVPFKKGMAVIRSYEFNGAHSTDGRLGEVSMPPPKNNIAPEWKPVVNGTLESVNKTMEDHFNAVQNSGIGLMYGPKSDFAKMTDAQKASYISWNRKPGSAAPTPRETSCVGFVLNNLAEGYKNAGKSERWAEIDAIVRANDGDGNFLLQELKKDGWTTVYWNPDAKNPTQEVAHASKPPDHHIWTASEVKKGHNYLAGVKLHDGERFDGVPIDTTLLDYRPTNPYQTTPQTEALKKLQEAPLFVGIANGGYHVFLGSQGNVIESHSTRGPTDPTNIEIRPFTEWGLLEGESYLSGVIAVPPGGWGSQRQ
ncbi:MAG: hypothetical protein ABIR96_07255 [Bdellovibrionota bacterium]